MVGSESDKGDRVHEPSHAPTKLSLLNSPPTMPPGTPPPQTTVSVPFKWEEAPGKPRHCHTQSEPARTLELPPRLLLLHAKVSNMDGPSPTTVLDGPYVGRAMSFTSSYRTPREHWNSGFGSTRWSGFRKINKEDDEGSFDFSTHCSTKPKVKITRVSKRGNFFTLSKPRSHLWASIYESFKQVVPWRRKQHTKNGPLSTPFDL
ncbi:uncharacterized protein At4g00950-like [Abrus precatorius]|uniref:Uncharacterized protein At4g00950-like n=1 Tax=Abrus precatorius TaxID=3816 RepID=A0A8B8K8A2_ABRPR|nr:uncharacterized protein At4g00950-like [Abrus precatorius]